MGEPRQGAFARRLAARALEVAVRLALDAHDALTRGRRLERELLLVRAELTGMSQRLDAVVAALESLQVAAGLHLPVVEGAPCITCGGVLYRERVPPRVVTWEPTPQRFVRCLGCNVDQWIAAPTPAGRTTS